MEGLRRRLCRGVECGCVTVTAARSRVEVNPDHHALQKAGFSLSPQSLRKPTREDTRDKDPEYGEIRNTHLNLGGRAAYLTGVLELSRRHTRRSRLRWGTHWHPPGLVGQPISVHCCVVVEILFIYF